MAQHFTLSDGRKIDFRVSGRTNATPLLWFHGTPGAYLAPPGIEAACEKHGLSLVAFTRPGYGLSTRQKGRRVIDTVADADELLKHLGHEKFYVGGWSGGGPYTLACAARLPGCIAALCVAGVAPFDAEGLDFLAGQGEDNIQEYNAALAGEPQLQAFCKPVRVEMLKANLEDTIQSLSSLLPEVDKRALLDHSELGSYLVDVTQEALKDSADGWVDDDLAFIQPWGFEVSEVKVPVFLYQGDLDAMVPFDHGKWLGAHIPSRHLTSHLEKGEGHISIYLGRVDSMVQELVGVK